MKIIENLYLAAVALVAVVLLFLCAIHWGMVPNWLKIVAVIWSVGTLPVVVRGMRGAE